MIPEIFKSLEGYMFSLEIHRRFLAMHNYPSFRSEFDNGSFLHVQEAAEVLAPWLEIILQHIMYAFGIYQVRCTKARYMHAGLHHTHFNAHLNCLNS